MKPLDWVSFGTGVWSLVLLLWTRHGWAALAVAVVLAVQVSGFLRRLPRPPGSRIE